MTTKKPILLANRVLCVLSIVAWLTNWSLPPALHFDFVFQIARVCLISLKFELCSQFELIQQSLCFCFSFAGSSLYSETVIVTTKAAGMNKSAQYLSPSSTAWFQLLKLRLVFLVCKLTAPESPTGLEIVGRAGSRSVVVHWQPPVREFGCPVRAYRLELALGWWKFFLRYASHFDDWVWHELFLKFVLFIFRRSW